jgi:hypothetical protein
MILLNQDVDDEAVRAAVLRRAFALRGHKEQFRPSADQTEMLWLFLEIIGTRAEAAAHLLFELPWTPYSESYVGNGDIAGFVEVKGVARPDDRIFIKKERLKPEHAYLLMDGAFHPAWHPIGWIWGREVRAEWLHPYRDQPPNYKVPRAIPPMHPVKELLLLVRERQRS